MRVRLVVKLFILALILMAPSASAGGKISDFQWKNRLLVIPESTGDLKNQLDNEQTGLEERDLKVFILSGPGSSDYPTDKELATEFSKRLSPDPDHPKIFLIGKDGRTTLSWKTTEFSFEKLYASIDAMPMRQREMREDR